MEAAFFLDPSYRIMRGQGEKNLIDRSKQTNSRNKKEYKFMYNISGWKKSSLSLPPYIFKDFLP